MPTAYTTTLPAKSTISLYIRTSPPAMAVAIIAPGIVTKVTGHQSTSNRLTNQGSEVIVPPTTNPIKQRRIAVCRAAYCTSNPTANQRRSDGAWSLIVWDFIRPDVVIIAEEPWDKLP